MEEDEDFQMTSEEAKRIRDALKKQNFRDLLVQYAEEISDPENKKLYEQELTELEKQRGVDVQFINPEPGFVLKAFLLPDKKKKAFINVCHCDVLAKASPSGKPSLAGRKGQHWNIPFSLSPPREDYDKAKNKCVVFDVIFHPETYKLGERDPRMKKLLIDTALDGIENHLHTKLDREDIRELHMTCKGTPEATVVRKKRPYVGVSDGLPTGLEFPFPPLREDLGATTAEAKKKTKGSSKKKTKYPKKDSPTFAAKSEAKSEAAKPLPLDTKPHPKEPGYRVVHRGEFSMQDFTFDRMSSKIKRPKELVVTVELPGLESASQVELDIFEKQVLLKSTNPDYSLDLALSYPVNEEKGTAKFDKVMKTLTIILPVLPLLTKTEAAPVVSSLVSEIDSELTNQELESLSRDSEGGSHDLLEDSVPEQSGKDSSEELTNQDGELKLDHMTQNWMSNRVWSCPPFSYRQDDDHVIFLLYTSLVKEKSLVTHFDTHECHVTFTKDDRSYSLYLSFPDGCSLLPTECKVDISKKNVVLILKKEAACRSTWTKFRVGVNAEQSMEKYFLTVENVENALAEVTHSTSEWHGAGWSEKAEFKVEGSLGTAEEAEQQLSVTITDPFSQTQEEDTSLASDEHTTVTACNDDITAKSTVGGSQGCGQVAETADLTKGTESEVSNQTDEKSSTELVEQVSDTSTNSTDGKNSSECDEVLDASNQTDGKINLLEGTESSLKENGARDMALQDTETGQTSLNEDGSTQSPVTITESGKNLKLGNQLIYSLDLD